MLCSLLVPLLLSLAVPPVQSVRVMLADGRVVTGKSGVLRPGSGLALSREDGILNLSHEDLFHVEFLAPPPDSYAWKPSACVHYHDGSFLVGEIIGGDDAYLRLRLDQSVAIQIPIDAIQTLFLGDGCTERDPADYPIGEESDAIFRTALAGGDFTTGTFLSFGEEKFVFEYSLGAGEFPIDEIEAVTLSMQLSMPERDFEVVALDLWPDGVLKGTLVETDSSSVGVVPLFLDEPVVLPKVSVRGIRYRQPQAVWLSDLEPVDVVQIPYLGPEDFFLYPYRRDRAVSGKPLEVAGRRFARGFGCHSRTELQFSLEGLNVRSLRTYVGVSAEVIGLADPGSIEFAVLVDGQEVFRSAALRAVDPPLLLPSVDLKQASSLTLVTDFGSGGDVADRGVWGNPILFLD